MWSQRANDEALLEGRTRQSSTDYEDASLPGAEGRRRLGRVCPGTWRLPAGGRTDSGGTAAAQLEDRTGLAGEAAAGRLSPVCGGATRGTGARGEGEDAPQQGRGGAHRRWSGTRRRCGPTSLPIGPSVFLSRRPPTAGTKARGTSPTGWSRRGCQRAENATAVDHSCRGDPIQLGSTPT